MCARKRKTFELREAEPYSLRWSPRNWNQESLERDAVAGDGVFEGAQGMGLSAVNGQGLQGQLQGIEFAAEDFDVRELPETGIYNVIRTLLNQVAAFVFESKHHKAPVSDGRARRRLRERLGCAELAGGAESIHWTFAAAGLTRRANQGAHLHEGLVQSAARTSMRSGPGCGGNERLGDLPQRLARIAAQSG